MDHIFSVFRFRRTLQVQAFMRGELRGQRSEWCLKGAFSLRRLNEEFFLQIKDSIKGFEDCNTVIVVLEISVNG